MNLPEYLYLVVSTGLAVAVSYLTYLPLEFSRHTTLRLPFTSRLRGYHQAGKKNYFFRSETLAIIACFEGRACANRPLTTLTGE